MALGNKMKSIEIKAVCTGVIVAFGIGFLTLALLSVLITEHLIGEKHTDRMILLLLMISSYAGGISSNLIIGNKRIYIAVGACTIYTCTLLLMGLLLFDGTIQNLWISLFMIGIGCTISCFTKKTRNTKHHKRK